MHNLARPTSRPLRLLSDMQAMMEETQAFENRVLERLNAGKTVRSFLIATVELLTEAVNILVLQVFRKDDYAVKYAVEPLLEGSGPLGDLSVRLKLIYGLGVISRAEYEDAELLMALREELNHDGNEYSFTDDEIIGPFGELHCVAALPPTPQFDDSDAELLAMQKLRYQQMVRSINALIPVPSGRRSAGKADDNIPDAAGTTLPYPEECLAVHAADAETFSNTP